MSERCRAAGTISLLPWADGVELSPAEIAALPIAVADDDVPWQQDEPGEDYSGEAEHASWIASLPPDIRAIWQAPPWTGDGEAIPAGFLHRDCDGPSGDGFASGGVYDVLPPGPQLAHLTAVAAARGTKLGESELIGVLCAWQRLTSWAQAGQAAALGTLIQRRKAQSVQRQSPSLSAHLDDEAAAALALTSRAADRLLQVAAALTELPGVHAALAAGRIDWAKACLFTELLAGLPGRDANDIAAAILGHADRKTTGQLRAELLRAVMSYDPESAQKKREAASKEASVQLWSEPSGNNALAGRELDPADAIRASSRLTALARWLQQNGAAGSTDQLRAAAYVALLTGRPASDLLPPVSDRPAGGAGSRGDRAVSCGGGQPASDGWPRSDAPPAAMAGDSSAANGWPQLSGSINLTMPLSAWLGLDRPPGELAGYGTADAATCHQLAASMGLATRWCLTLTGADHRAVAHACARQGPGEPGCGAIAWAKGLRGKLQFLNLGDCSHGRRASGYKPPRALLHLVRVRQRTCSFPGCRRPGRRTDLDHTLAYHKGGITCECNLAPLCRRHHRAKQADRWNLTQDQPGVMTWTLPSGRSYTTSGEPYPV